MLDVDSIYLKDILHALNVSKYKLSETPTRFKICTKPAELQLKALHTIQNIKSPVGIEIHLTRGLYLDCLKGGKSRKRRRTSVDKFTGKIPPKYKTEHFEQTMRLLLGNDNVCEFSVREHENKLEIKSPETFTYPILKEIETSGVDIKFDFLKSTMTFTLKV